MFEGHASLAEEGDTASTAGIGVNEGGMGSGRMLKGAEQYAARGWHVIPLHEPLFDADGRCIGCSCEAWRRQNGTPNYVCPKPGKHPRIRDWESRATTDAAQIGKWWRSWPKANIGIAAGPSRLVVVDKDTYLAPENDGYLLLADTQTVTSLTGGGGEHLVYRHPTDGPEIRNDDKALPAWVNIRAHGGQFVAPPSLHSSGNRYEWEPGYGPHEMEPAELPPALRELLQPAKAKRWRAVPLPERIAEGGRNNALASLGGSLRRRGLGGAVIQTALLAVNEAQCDPPLSDAEVKAIAQSVTRYAPSPSANGHKRPASNGAMGQSGGSGAAEGTTGQATGAGQSQGGTAATESSIYSLSYRPEDGGIMDVWHDLHGDEWIYATGFEQWHFYAGTHWQADAGGYALRAQIVALMDKMNEAARTLRTAAEHAGDKAEVKRLTAYVDATKRTAARVASVEGLARLRCYVAADDLDAADVLNLANGVLDLGTLAFRPHNRSDLVTYCLPYLYDPAAVAPNWAVVLGRIEEETRNFLQEYAGYALTPDTRHELAIWLYGPPGRGASTLLTGLQAMLGPKAALIGLADIERNRFALANLPGKTLAVATEQPADYIAATHILNALISGEPVTVDRKYRDAVTITPRAKLAWAMNELPRVKGAGNGVFRRVKVVTFPAIPEHERRAELKELVKTEAAGILNWALEGLRRLRARGGFVVPAAVEKATEAFSLQNDIPKVFIEECCETGPGLSIGSKKLYSAYINWCTETGHKAQSMTSIADDWERLGFQKIKTMPGMVWLGVDVKP